MDTKKQQDFILTLIDTARSHRSHYQRIIDLNLNWNIETKDPNKLRLKDNYLLLEVFEDYEIKRDDYINLVTLFIDDIDFIFFWTIK